MATCSLGFRARETGLYRSICHSVNAWLHIEGERCGEKEEGGGIVAARAHVNPDDPLRARACTLLLGSGIGVHFYISRIFQIFARVHVRVCAFVCQQRLVRFWFPHCLSSSLQGTVA